MTQEEDVVRYMTIHGSITQKQAIDDLGVYRLSAVIWRLRRDGYAITSRNIKVNTRRGTTTVAQYVFTNAVKEN